MERSLIVLFTGHRDAECAEEALDLVAYQYPNSVWIHGGAEGFDTQVDTYAKAHGIPVIPFKPDYKKYKPKEAPLRRDDLMLSKADVVVALYDGRKSGGTYYTVKNAEKLKLKVVRITRK